MVAHLYPQGFSRIREVLTFVPFSRATLWRRVRTGEFPRPVRVAGISCWRNKDLLAWIDAQAGAAEVAK